MNGLTATRWLCRGCNARVDVGDPHPNNTWPARLNLTRKQVDELLIAAAEYEELSEEQQSISNAIEFVDWVGGVTLGDEVAG